MTLDGFFALLVLLLFAGVSFALSFRSADVGVSRGRSARRVRYYATGAIALVLAAGLTWSLWDFEPPAVASGTLYLGPAPVGFEFLLPLLFFFVGAAITFLLALQQWTFGGPVFSPDGDVDGATNDAADRRLPLVLLAIGAVAWAPSLAGYELVRDTWAEVDPDAVRVDGFWQRDPVERSWSEVVRLEYRPWSSARSRSNVQHAMAFVFSDGSELELTQADLWGLDDEAVRQRLRRFARDNGVEYRIVK